MVHFTQKTPPPPPPSGPIATLSIPARGSFDALFAGALNPDLDCKLDCEYDGTLKLAPTDAKRLGCLVCATRGATVARMEGTIAANGTEPSIFLEGRDQDEIRKVLAFPVMGTFEATLTVHVRWSGGSDTLVRHITLTWPTPASDRHGKGLRGLITGIRGPRRVKLRSKLATFDVKFSSRLKKTRAAAYYIDVELTTPGNHYGRGGILFLGPPNHEVVHIRLQGGGIGDAKKLAPLAAKLTVNLAPKHGNGPQDAAVFYLTLVH
jgi:hypothetical protein